jgi:hypothetical protein
MSRSFERSGIKVSACDQLAREKLLDLSGYDFIEFRRDNARIVVEIRDGAIRVRSTGWPSHLTIRPNAANEIEISL